MNDRILLFGGQDKLGYKSDLWELDLTAYEWSQIEHQGPKPRKFPGASEASDGFFLFGGWGRNDQFYNDLWLFDGEAFTKLAASMKGPHPRYSPVQVSYGGDVYLFGGLYYGGKESIKMFGDLWRFNTSCLEWTHLSSDGPCARYGSAGQIIDDKLVIFGGLHRQFSSTACAPGGRLVDTYHNDTWIYDFETDSWTERNEEPAPSPRYAVGNVASGDDLFIFGGLSHKYVYGGGLIVEQMYDVLRRIGSGSPLKTNDITNRLYTSEYHSDLWVYNLDAGWRELHLSESLPPLKSPIMASVADYLVVGFGQGLSNHSGRLWMVRPTSP